MHPGQKQSCWKQQHGKSLARSKKSVGYTRENAGSPSASLGLKHVVRCIEKSTLSRKPHVAVFTLKRKLCSCFCVWIALHVPLECTLRPGIPGSRRALKPMLTYGGK